MGNYFVKEEILALFDNLVDTLEMCTCDICKKHFHPTTAYCGSRQRVSPISANEKIVQKALGFIIDICTDCVVDYLNHRSCGLNKGHPIDSLDIDNWDLWK